MLKFPVGYQCGPHRFAHFSPTSWTCSQYPVWIHIVTGSVHNFHRQELESVLFRDGKISSLLFADDFLLASLNWDLQCLLRQFTVEWEVTGMRISTSTFPTNTTTFLQYDNTNFLCIKIVQPAVIGKLIPRQFWSSFAPWPSKTVLWLSQWYQLNTMFDISYFRQLSREHKLFTAHSVNQSNYTTSSSCNWKVVCDF